jgi:hypothetical protein
VNPWIAVGIYVLVAIMWLVPHRRIEGMPAEKQGLTLMSLGPA